MSSMKPKDFREFSDFYNYYMGIYANYNKYGDRVIEVEFEKNEHDYEEQIKSALESNLSEHEFGKSLTAIWDNFITFWVKSVNDLKKVPLDTKVARDLQSKIMQTHKRFKVSESFYNQIIKYEKYGRKTLAMSDSCLYLIIFDDFSFKINEKLPIEEILKD